MTLKNKRFTIICLILIIACLVILKKCTRSADTSEIHSELENNLQNTEITDENAKKMGITFDTVKGTIIHQKLQLTGRVILNSNKKATVRARFPGIIKEVSVGLGDEVKKNQTLATIEANESLREYDVVAPIDGSILERSTNIGDVATTEPLFKIGDLTSVWAKLHVFLQDKNKIRLNQAVKIHTLDNDQQFEGKIDKLLPIADEYSQTYMTITELPNEDKNWRPGMVIEGDVNIAEKKVELAVKENAIQQLEKDYVVFIKNGHEYEARPVTLGIKGDGYIEILHGLKKGELYVVEGSFIVKSDILKSSLEHDH